MIKASVVTDNQPINNESREPRQKSREQTKRERFAKALIIAKR